VPHPSRSELVRFSRYLLAPLALIGIDDHLHECSRCRLLLAELPAPPSYALGRPFPGVEVIPPSALEGLVRDWLSRFQNALASGAAIRIAGEGLTEKLLYQALAIVSSRMRRDGVQLEVRGNVFHGTSLPPRMNADAAILLEAPIFAPNFGEWSECRPGRLNLLVGHICDWNRIGVRPDLHLAPTFDAELALVPVVERLRDLAGRNRDGSELALLNAAGLDLPDAMCSGSDAQSPLVPLVDDRGLPLPWRALEWGQWLAREALGPFHANELLDIIQRLSPVTAVPMMAARLHSSGALCR